MFNLEFEEKNGELIVEHRSQEIFGGPEKEHAGCVLWPSGVRTNSLPCHAEEMLSMESYLFLKCAGTEFSFRFYQT